MELNPTVAKNILRDRLVDALIIGGNVVRWLAHELNPDTPQPGQQMASITYYPENRKDPEGSVSGSVSIPTRADKPDYTRQLAFHQRELTRGEGVMPEGQLNYHQRKVDVLSNLRRAA